ncbi:hypothetical protein [Agromyces sp. GXS1127]|uniref:hypothetical protein n=1 Tax=Agromyces sp. GXS1127 TaxID=3424181 RepID=UPI003D31BF15
MSALTEFTIAAANVLAELPNPEPQPIPGFEGVTTILGWAKWIGLIAGILALIGLGVLFMFNSRRGEGGEHVKLFVGILAGVLIIGAAAFIVGALSGA